jgi:nitrogen fixation/metabolism regulation signal transduction histidine kinase
MKRKFRKFLSRTLPALAILATLLVALFLASGLQREASGLSEPFILVVAVSGVALLVHTRSIVYRIVQLVRNVRNEVPGARLAARWVRNILVL